LTLTITSQLPLGERFLKSLPNSSNWHIGFLPRSRQPLSVRRGPYGSDSGDSLAPAETNVEFTLWILPAAVIGVSVSVGIIELAFARTRPGVDIVLPIARRLAAVRSLLAATPKTALRITRQKRISSGGARSTPPFCGASCGGLPIRSYTEPPREISR
jgi:hypothetical protein